MDQQNEASGITRATLLGEVPAPKGYQKRLDLKLCTRCGKEPCKPDSNLGLVCHPKVNQLKAKSARKQRAAAKRKKLCTRCTRRRRSPLSDSWCAPCLAELKRIRFPDVDQHVDHKGDRTRDHMERDGYARTRFHGQVKRGAPSTAALDSMDLRDALRDLAKAAEGYEYAQSDTVQQKPTIQRTSHTDDWIAIVTRIRKVLGEIQDRHPETMERISPEENRRRGVEIARKRRRRR